jgi:hypothetical protein
VARFSQVDCVEGFSFPRRGRRDSTKQPTTVLLVPRSSGRERHDDLVAAPQARPTQSGGGGNRVAAACLCPGGGSIGIGFLWIPSHHDVTVAYVAAAVKQLTLRCLLGVGSRGRANQVCVLCGSYRVFFRFAHTHERERELCREREREKEAKSRVW